MDWILFIRIVIFVTFLLLLAEGVAAIIMSRHFYGVYIRGHREVEEDIKAHDRRIKALEEHLI
jgi:hypothetical protein